GQVDPDLVLGALALPDAQALDGLVGVGPALDLGAGDDLGDVRAPASGHGPILEGRRSRRGGEHETGAGHAEDDAEGGDALGHGATHAPSRLTPVAPALADLIVVGGHV